ncbi:MAG: dicarboxylate/amino acid:cation symporter [Planctomycetes bacterium]|nr:dicarboxylate/amino acid:cation symporter [Planctomycetota bacterium]
MVLKLPVRFFKQKLHNQIFIAIILGIVVGALAPGAVRYVSFLGDIFVAALKMIIAPLVFASILAGTANMGKATRLGVIAGKTLAYYMTTTFIAVLIGLVLVNIVRPGALSEKDKTEAKRLAEERQIVHKPVTVGKFLHKQIGKVLQNPFTALAETNVLAIIFFSLFLGIVLATMGERGRPVIDVMNSFNDAMLKMTHVIMLYAPIGVFALMAKTISQRGIEAIVHLGWYMATVLAGLAIHGVIVLPLFLLLLARVNPWRYFNHLKEALLVSFSTSSSSATLPVTLSCVEEKAGIPNRVAGFVLPLGATINMDGTALYEAVAALFIAQFHGIDLSVGQQVIIFLTATLAAVGAAGIPSAGTITMIMVLQAVGLPVEGIGMILAVDRILDMCRTTVNVWGDAVGAAVVARSEGEGVRREA